MATAEAQQAYRARRAAGVPPRVVHGAGDMPGPVVPWRDGLAGELESVWQVEFRRAFSGWLLGQRSQHTRRAYHQAWRMWCGWCERAGVDPIEPGAGAGGAWLGSMQEQGLAAQTVRLRGIAVRAALTMLSIEGLRAGGDPFFAHKFPQIFEQASGVGLSTVQVGLLRDAAHELPGRYEAAVLLCAVVGLRAVEAGQVRDDVLEPYQGGMVATVVRKGGHTGVVPIPASILRAAARDRWPGRPDRSVAWNADAVSRMVTFAWSKTGEAGTVRSHALRHWHVTSALEAGVALNKVQDSVGHRDPKTTQKYNDARRVIEGHSAFTVDGLLS